MRRACASACYTRHFCACGGQFVRRAPRAFEMYRKLTHPDLGIRPWMSDLGLDTKGLPSQTYTAGHERAEAAHMIGVPLFRLGIRR